MLEIMAGLLNSYSVKHPSSFFIWAVDQLWQSFF